MKCLDKQYAENQVFEEKGGNICNSGVMHFCKVPMDVLSYYSPFCNDANEVVPNTFAKVEALADCQDKEDKSATTKIKIGAKINLAGLCKAQIEYVKEQTKKVCTSGDGAHSSTSGYKAHSSTSGYKAHSSTSGDWAHSSTSGENSVAVALGSGGWAKAAKGNWLVLAEYDDDMNLLLVKTVKVDGETIKENVFYTLKNGEFVEAEGEEK